MMIDGVSSTAAAYPIALDGTSSPDGPENQSLEVFTGQVPILLESPDGEAGQTDATAAADGDTSIDSVKTLNKVLAALRSELI